MRFADLLKATVLVSAGAATALAAVTVAGATADDNARLVLYLAGWWVAAGLIGVVIGRRAEATPPIASLLSSAKATPTLPELRPGRTMLNRLWPLLVPTIAAGAVSFVWPQIPGIACGFAIIWALAWRRQDAAVQAIEDRDGAQFFVAKTSPFEAIELVRTPGFMTAYPTSNGKAEVDPALDRG